MKFDLKLAFSFLWLASLVVAQDECNCDARVAEVLAPVEHHRRELDVALHQTREHLDLVNRQVGELENHLRASNERISELEQKLQSSVDQGAVDQLIQDLKTMESARDELLRSSEALQNEKAALQREGEVYRVSIDKTKQDLQRFQKLAADSDLAVLELKKALEIEKGKVVNMRDEVAAKAKKIRDLESIGLVEHITNAVKSFVKGKDKTQDL